MNTKAKTDEIMDIDYRLGTTRKYTTNEVIHRLRSTQYDTLIDLVKKERVIIDTLKDRFHEANTSGERFPNHNWVINFVQQGYADIHTLISQHMGQVVEELKNEEREW